MRDHLKPECTSSKSLQTINAGEGVEKREPSYTVGGNVNWGSHYRKQYGSSCSSVQFSHSVVSDSLQPHESQHTRPPCPSPTPGVHSNSCPLSQWCHPAISSLSSPSPPAPNPSEHQGLFQWVNSSHEVVKVLKFSFSISPSNEHPGLISRMDWLDLLAVQRPLKSLLQHHSSKAPIFRHSAFFTVQLSHTYMTTGKTVALTTWTLLAK